MGERRADEPVFGQRLYMHLNGGSDYSELHYDVLRDGEPTGIKRHKRTDGSPKYLVTLDAFVAGNEMFDVLETKGVGMWEWLEIHSRPEGSVEHADEERGEAP